jgi:AraC-like DNA-binding protein
MDAVANRVGLYAWGGPGTVRMLAEKYFDPQIHRSSFMHLYDRAFLREAKQKLGVTDMWVTYSWGFSDATERSDRAFITRRLPYFEAENIATHAYIQGFNLVTAEFQDRDVFCRDSRGRLLVYSKHRSLTCPNNPHARQIIIDRVQSASREAFDGIFIDNILFGLPPFYIRQDFASFFGCSCKYCQQRFEADFGYSLPLRHKVGRDVLRDYVRFRCQSVYDVLAELAQIARDAGKQFGINLYDPFWHTPEVYFGYSLEQVTPLLDYYLVENHALGKSGQIDNTHLMPVISANHKPVFVVSYRDGISYDAMYSQADIDAIWSEAAALGYSPCLKATEYITHGTWHALELAEVQEPAVRPIAVTARSKCVARPKASALIERRLVRFFNPHYARLFRLTFENRLLFELVMRTRLVMFLLKYCRSVTFSH